MNFGEAMIAAVHGRLVRRPTWGGNWHARYFAPTDRDDQSPALWMAEGWPAAIHSYAPQFDADDILADDWAIVDPVSMIRCQVGEIVQARDEEEDE
jgi:hypothetical protein